MLELELYVENLVKTNGMYLKLLKDSNISIIICDYTVDPITWTLGTVLIY